jgi:GNAT superfamily N-acetyltransferase
VSAADSGPAARTVRDADAQDLFGLLALCFAEYPGCFVDPHEDMPDIRTPTCWLARPGGAFWVVEDARGRVGACIAVDRPEPEVGELHRLYVRPDLRGAGLARGLIAMAERHAAAQGARSVIAWSDTRFLRAHALYRGLGYDRRGLERRIGDISNSAEYCFERALA